MNERAEPPPIFFATKAIAATPTSSTSVIHTEKYSMIASTTSTIAPDWMKEGIVWETSWRSVSMSLV